VAIMTKARIRVEAKEKRRAHVAALTPAERCVAAVLLAQRVEAHLGDSCIAAIYLPIGSEIDTLPLIDRLHLRGLSIALPHVPSRKGPMRFLAWLPGDPLPGGPMGLRQPAADAQEVQPDLILTPLLAFDARLHRLGYGAGFYDRAFAALPGARRVGLAWSMQQVPAIADERWDVPLHAVATEKDWIEP
jgi:5-formyltetrahydrofolate cyclo-ligase